MRIFERDSDQDGCPDGFTAYILRAPVQVLTGRVVEVKVENGLPHLFYEGDASSRPPRYPGEQSRIFVKQNARIDPAVYDLEVE